MNEETRLNIQYEIIQLLFNRYSGLNADDEECHDEARRDSYKIIGIIEKYIGKENE